MTSALHSGILFGTAFALSAVLVPVLKVPAQRIGLVDDPCHRKRHLGTIPLTGGLAMFLAFMATILIHAGDISEYSGLFAGMAIMLLIGVLDDIFDLRAVIKLIAQIIVASLVVILGGLEINQIGPVFGSAHGPVGLGPFSIPLTVACIVFMMNVINMADGVDGLAGGIGFITLSMLALVGWLNGAPASLTTICLVLALCVAGFLIWNMRFPFRKSASAFMGDAGSMMLGFAIAWLAIAMATTPGSKVYPVSIAWILLIPCMDTLAIAIRRIRCGRSPMMPDRTHLHHIFQRCHLSVTTTVGVIHIMVLASGLFGIIGWQLGWPQWVLFVLAAGIMVGYTVLLLNAHRVLRRVRSMVKGLTPES
jgi:UDP-GlcNAc:undecaprenyl-phosphate/decaprenyl-phosphate GlcNAc-1-phosphate transferase